MYFITDKRVNINNCQDDKIINKVINWSLCEKQVKIYKTISDKEVKFSHKQLNKYLKSTNNLHEQVSPLLCSKPVLPEVEESRGITYVI